MVELTRDMADDLEQASVILKALADGILAGGHDDRGLLNEVQELQGKLHEYASGVPKRVDPLRPKGLPVNESDDADRWRAVAVQERRSQMGSFLPKYS